MRKWVGPVYQRPADDPQKKMAAGQLMKFLVFQTDISNES